MPSRFRSQNFNIQCHLLLKKRQKGTGKSNIWEWMIFQLGPWACVTWIQTSTFWFIPTWRAFSQLAVNAHTCWSVINHRTFPPIGANFKELLTSPEKFAQQIYLVTSQPFRQKVSILAGSLFYIAEQKYLLSEILCLAALWDWVRCHGLG